MKPCLYLLGMKPLLDLQTLQSLLYHMNCHLCQLLFTPLITMMTTTILMPMSLPVPMSMELMIRVLFLLTFVLASREAHMFSWRIGIRHSGHILLSMIEVMLECLFFILLFVVILVMNSIHTCLR